jgi:thiamine biosynthesis lipoprotein
MEITNGAFDPTAYLLVNAWGFGPEKKKIERTKIDNLLQFVGFQFIKLKRNRIVKKDSRMALDSNPFIQYSSRNICQEGTSRNRIWTN